MLKVVIIVLLLFFISVNGQKCMRDDEVLNKYPEAHLCKDYIHEIKYVFQNTSLKHKQLANFYHSALTGISAAIVGKKCKDEGLRYFCSSIFLKCVTIPLGDGTSWPAQIFVPSLPCYDVCDSARKACKNTDLESSINCTAFQDDEYFIPTFNATINCTYTNTSYRDSKLMCPKSLSFDQIEQKCDLSCPDIQYGTTERYILTIISGWICFIIAIICAYIIPPAFHKAITEPIFNTSNKKVARKLIFLFVFNLFLYTFSYTPYIAIPFDDMWCTNGVFGRSLDNNYVAFMGFFGLAPMLSYRGYWFMMLFDMWTFMRFNISVIGGIYLWLFILFSVGISSYTIIIWALCSNNISSSPSLQPISFISNDNISDLKMYIIDIPLTVIALLSLPIIIDLIYLLAKLWWKNRETGIKSRYYQYLRITITYLLYEISLGITVIFFWYINAKNSTFMEGYINYIQCAIANIDTSLCVNDALQSVPWLMFIGIFPLACLVPIVFILLWGKDIHQWWYVLLFKRRIPDLSKLATISSNSNSNSNKNSSNSNKNSFNSNKNSFNNKQTRGVSVIYDRSSSNNSNIA